MASPDEVDVLKKAANVFREKQPDITDDDLKVRLNGVLGIYRQRQTGGQSQPKPNQTPPVQGQETYQDDLQLQPKLVSKSMKGLQLPQGPKVGGNLAVRNSYKLQNQEKLEAKDSGQFWDKAKVAAQTIPLVGPAMTVGEHATNILDTTGRLGREQATAHFQNRESNLTDAFMNRDNVGNDTTFHNGLDKAAAEPEGQYFAKGLQGLGTGAQYAGTAAAYANPFTAPVMLGGGRKYVDPLIKAGSEALQSAAVDPATYLTMGYGAGSEAAATQVGRALGRTGIKMTPALATEVMRATETLSGPEYVNTIKQLFVNHGGDLKHLEAIAGPELEHLGTSKFRFGLPFAQDKAGIAPGEAIADLAHKITGKSLPENNLARLYEAGVKKLPGNFNLPLHTREAFQAERSSAVHNLRADVGEAVNEIKAGAKQNNIDLSEQTLKNISKDITINKKEEAVAKFQEWVHANIPNAPPEVLDGARTAFNELGKIHIPVYDEIVSIFKNVKLFGNPVWAVLNGVEETLKMVASGIRDPKVGYKALKVWKGMPDNHPLITRPSGDIFTAGMFKKLQRAAGIGEDLKFEAGISSKLQQGVADVGSLGINRLVRKGEKFRDTFFRNSFLIDQLEKGNSPQRALNNMQKVLFDTTVGNAHPGVQRATNALKKVIPFLGYGAKSAATVPMLAAKNPAATLLPINFYRGLQRQSDRPNELPRNYLRNSGAYTGLPTDIRKGASQVSNALGAGEIPSGLSITAQQRGTLPEATGALEQTITDPLGQLPPPIGPIVNAAFGRNHFGDTSRPTQWSDVPGELISGIVSSPFEKIANYGYRKLTGNPQSIIGMNNQQDPNDPYTDQRFLLGMANSFNPFGQRYGFTTPADIEAEKQNTSAAKNLKERMLRAKQTKRITKKGKKAK